MEVFVGAEYTYFRLLINENALFRKMYIFKFMIQADAEIVISVVPRPTSHHACVFLDGFK